MHEQTRCADRDQHALSFACLLVFERDAESTWHAGNACDNDASVAALATRPKTIRGNTTLVHGTIKCIANAVPWSGDITNFGHRMIRDGHKMCATSCACVASHIALGMRTGARVLTSTRVSHSCTVTESDGKQPAVFIRH